MSARLAGLGLVLTLATQAPGGCGSPQPSKAPPERPGIVVARTLVGTGVILRVSEREGGWRDHAYDTRQAGCTVGAAWPACVKGT